jgi:hypothetical protein
VTVGPYVHPSRSDSSLNLKVVLKVGPPGGLDFFCLSKLNTANDKMQELNILICMLIAAIQSVGAQYCLPGAHQATCETILIVHSADISYAADVQAKLKGTGSFMVVDTIDANFATPTSSQLEAYDAIIVFNNRSFSNRTRFGDLLAAYHDQGGGVVMAFISKQYEQWSDTNFMGAYGTPANGYTILDYISGNVTSTSESLGDLLEPQSPLLKEVVSLSALLAYRSTALVINGGIVVAQWGGGGRVPLVVRGERGNRTLVALNFFPASSSVNPALWTGDGAALMRNALKFSRCMLCQAGTFSIPGEHNSRVDMSTSQSGTPRATCA